MAALDDLLSRIEDPALRADIERELVPLRGGQSLGLVFERHMPEQVQLYGHPIRRGLTVCERSVEGDAPEWRVISVKGKRVSLQRVDEEGQLLKHKANIKDLVVVRRFGDPIYPGLESVARLEKGGERPFHTVINAENFHALELLLFTHEEKVDAIFIDPPYNTEARDWKYNNDYVSPDDRYRHSKWLAMMERRLRVAQQLLNPSRSVLIVSIDENEVHRLALLLEDLFPGSKIQMVTAMINPAGATIIDQFSRVEEHLFFVHIGSARPARTTTDTTPGTSKFKDEEGKAKPFRWSAFQRSGGNSRRQDTKKKFFPVYINEKTNSIDSCGDSVALGIDRREAEDPPKGCVAQWPIKKDGSEACWQLSPQTFRKYLADGRIRISKKRNKKTGRWGLYFLGKGDMRAIDEGELVVDGRDENGALIVRNADDTERTILGKTLWTNGSYSAREHGSRLLREFLPGRQFPFPKSLYLVEDALRFYVGKNPTATVLDFFAGSGSTGHAVMRLNHEDGGSRTCISVTNNEVSEEEAEELREKGRWPGDKAWEEKGIFEFVTQPRLTAAVTGTTPEGKPVEGSYRFRDEFPFSEGFEENIEFFRITYEDKDLVKLNAAFSAIAPILWIKAGSQGPRIEEIEGSWAMPRGGRYGVLFETDDWPSFVEAISEEESASHAFIVTDSDSVFQRVAAELPSDIEPMRLYEAYLTSFAINTSGPS